MKVIVFEEQAYYKMLEEVKEIVKDATKKTDSNESDWISTQQAKELLGFKSKSKLQQLRDNAEIIFSQHGRIIKYSRKSIISFLDNNTVR